MSSYYLVENIPGQLNLNDQQKSMIINDFTFSREADGSRVLKGQGGFSSVYEGFRMNGMNRVEMAIKEYNQNVTESKVMAELKIAMAIPANRNIANFLGVTGLVKPYSLAFELCQVDLDTFIRYHPRLQKTPRDWLLYDLAAGIHHIHTNQFVHTDLKMANVFVDTRLFVLKIGDLGEAKPLHEAHYQKDVDCWDMIVRYLMKGTDLEHYTTILKKIEGEEEDVCAADLVKYTKDIVRKEVKGDWAAADGSNYACTRCPHYFTKNAELLRHLPHHNPLFGKVCHGCDARFRDDAALNGHLKISLFGSFEELIRSAPAVFQKSTI